MEDLISRQAVIDLAYDMSEIDGEHFTESCMVVDVADIQKLSSVRPQEPKTGHWIYQNGYVPFKWKCDQCFAEHKTDFNYCPTCGARMESEE